MALFTIFDVLPIVHKILVEMENKPKHTPKPKPQQKPQPKPDYIPLREQPERRGGGDGNPPPKKRD